MGGSELGEVGATERFCSVQEASAQPVASSVQAAKPIEIAGPGPQGTSAQEELSEPQPLAPKQAGETPSPSFKTINTILPAGSSR